MATPIALLHSVLNKLRRDAKLARFRRRAPGADARAVFEYYFRNNLFGSPESVSGTGSTLRATRSIRRALPQIIESLGARSVLDIPCGDFNWARAVDWRGADYTGADIVPALVARNRARFEAPGRRFVVLDILADPLPRADLVLCRDLFIHFPNARVADAVANLKRSGSGHLLTTHYFKARNWDITMGSFRPICLTRPPFHFPEPLRILRDDDRLEFGGRTLSLWRIADLP